MKLVWSATAWEDDRHWQATDRETRVRINDLIKASRRTPLSGIGKVEPLRGNLKGWWSRRITGEHRLVYRVTGAGTDQILAIVRYRWHDDA